ncbi:uncharacterized protein LOC128265930 [Drosophila gunungcola]|uniref:uncharacterized protein LOC128265930 n=1 Tax=Drosophila gunungcola TaxID=103775 RepID=UPI0022E6A246|nr:uncharacterized protein LOC128265930 [Drosophila gunungcola]
MQEIADDARGRSPILIAGDFNAWSTTWGSASTTQRGTILLEALASLNVCLLNEGNRPTLSKSDQESIIDLTFASPELARNCAWRVSDIYNHSDHALIITQTRPRLASPTSRLTSYKAHTLNTVALLALMEGVCVTGDANTCAKNLADRVKAACDASMEKATKGGNGRRPVPWWNEEINGARRDCLAARRRCQRSRGRENQKLSEATYRAKRKVLKNAIKASKARCFQELCEAADAEPFGSAYRMVMGKLNRQPTPTNQLQLGNKVATLFPTQPPLTWQASGLGDTVLTSEAEVLAALRKTKAGKAPGPDGIPNAALHTIVAAYPGIFTEMYNKCIIQGSLDEQDGSGRD